MRNFLITLLALFVSFLPFLAFLVSLCYLGDLSRVVGVSTGFSYFLFGIITGYSIKSVWKKYQIYWCKIWDYAGDKL
jgi:hypothetical protein